MRGRVILLALLLAACSRHAPSSSGASLLGTSWRLIDLADAEMVESVRPTLAIAPDGRIEGHASCNRYFGQATISGSTIRIEGVGSTKMACPEPVMGQEQHYLGLLQRATRYGVEGSILTIWLDGETDPLRFERGGVE